jgi:predicted RNA binding protein YcfA (HicA-like mRNA interferase family)
MTAKLPVVSGDDLVRVLRKFGYEIVRQKGSHVRLRNEGSAKRLPVTVPLHKELARGTLKSILADAGLTVQDILATL